MTRVLFIGLAESSHTASWIDLLEKSSIDFALFGLPTGALPASKTIPTYMSDRRARRGASDYNLLHLTRVRTLVLNLLALHSEFRKLMHRAKKVFCRIFLKILHNQNSKQDDELLLQFQLRAFIQTFQPRVIHTLGIFPSSDLFLSVASEFPNIVWVAQVRGGPDLELGAFDPIKKEKIKLIFERAHKIICDSENNYLLAKSLGADGDKFSMGVVSGSGGLNLNEFIMDREYVDVKLSSRHVVWPKAYESLTSKASPVIEAINLAWDDIKPVTFTFLWLEDKELELWLRSYLRPEILPSIKILKRIEHSEALKVIRDSQVVLAPSIMDGIPNVMLESMMLNTVPIVSPIPTIKTFVSDPENVIFARNLYPEELAAALVRSLNDSIGNKKRVAANRKLVESLYDREGLKKRLTQMYEDLAP
jgi:glycosyltransferase involved in cell wall biosynthesis